MIEAVVSPVRRLYLRWHGMPLRTRLTTVAALSATVAIVSVVGVAYIAVHHVLRGQVDQQLRRSAQEEVSGNGFVCRFSPGEGEIRGYSQLIAPDGTTVSCTADREPLPITSRPRTGFASATSRSRRRTSPSRARFPVRSCGTATTTAGMSASSRCQHRRRSSATQSKSRCH